MAKRTRASRSAHRPGGQGPNRSKKTTDSGSSPAPSPDAETTAAEEIGATYSEVEVDEVAVATVAATASPKATEEPSTGRRARRRAKGRSSKKAQDDLATRAAAETVWVRADLRRIGIVSIVLFAALAVAYVIFGVLDVLNLY